MEIEAEIERFKSDWEIEFQNKRIARRKRRLYEKVSDFFRPPKYPVLALYRFCQHHLGTADGIVHPNFIDRSKGTDVAKIPSWFEISEPWGIAAEDLKYLAYGPLIQGDEVLVSAYPETKWIATFWEWVGKFAALGGAITFIAWMFE